MADQRQGTGHEDALFRRLLVFLDGGQTDAGEGGEWERRGQCYETVRWRLTRLFLWKGCPEDEADVLADRTFDRVMSVLDRAGEGFDQSYEGDPLRYVLGVARHVFQEWLRRAPAPLGALAVGDEADAVEQERAHHCLDQCIERVVTGAERTLILGYYEGERRGKSSWRKNLAERHGISVNALRIQVCRIRGKLRQCVLDCMQAK